MDATDVCLLVDSPFRILWSASSNDVKKFNSLLGENPEAISTVDTNGWSVLHKAASKGSNDVMAIIFHHNLDVNAINNNGDTALHLAVQKGHHTTIELLVNHGADATKQDKKQLTPVHLAVQLKQHECLQSFFKSKKVEADVRGGEFEMTPLQLAAATDDLVSAKILLENGAYLCTRNSLGLTALHCAAKHASKQVLDLVLSIAESKGYTREFLLSNQDCHKSSPLHAAINSGNTEPVKVCLEAGAKITTRQADGSTAVHLVCTQGAIQIVQLMNEIQPTEFSECLTIQDDNGMTPLHRAVLFNFHELAKYIIEQGSPLNLKDCHGKTPLLLACSRLNWDSVAVLHSSGANVKEKDLESRNCVHLAIINGSNMSGFFESSFTKCPAATSLFNECDLYGCTPLHYASKEGNLSSICGLLSKGAKITCKDNSKYSALHFASKYGRVNTCKTLLETAQGGYIINEVNHEGKTALHLASEFGHVKVVALLMQRGALMHRDYQGNSPLHLAAKNGYTQTMKLLLTVHPALLNSENSQGNTPLHEAALANKPKSVSLLLSMDAHLLSNNEDKSFLDLAIEKSNSEAAMAVITHERWKDVLKSQTKTYGTYMLGLVRYLPDVACAALDRCAVSSNDDSSSRNYHITYSFELLNNVRVPKQANTSTKTGNKESVEEAPAGSQSTLRAMVDYQRVKCLSHPVSLKYVQMKWSSLGLYLYLANLFVYAVFLGCYTSTIMKVGPNPFIDELSKNTSEKLELQLSEYNAKVSANHPQIVIVLIFIIFNIIKELFQIYQQKANYFFDFSNYMEWLIYIMATLYLIPNLLGYHVHDWTYECGIAALFVAWVNFLLFLQRFELFGIYVVMFREITKTLLKVLAVFSILILAAGFTFFAILREEENTGFTTMGLSMFTSVIMMVGDMTYSDWFVTPSNDGDPRTLRYEKMAFIAMGFFLLLLPILLMNLMIGLAVGDIESVQKNARLKRLAMQVELTDDIEEKLPKFIMDRFHKLELVEYPNKCKALIKKVIDQMMMGGDGSDEGTGPERNDLYQMINLQKQRIKELQQDMKAQTDLLKLIVEKMEIYTELSYLDEGMKDDNLDISLILREASKAAPTSWKSKPVTETLTKVKVLHSFSKTIDSKDSAEDATSVNSHNTHL